jgi:hypothetical protein
VTNPGPDVSRSRFEIDPSVSFNTSAALKAHTTSTAASLRIAFSTARRTALIEFAEPLTPTTILRHRGGCDTSGGLSAHIIGFTSRGKADWPGSAEE